MIVVNRQIRNARRRLRLMANRTHTPLLVEHHLILFERQAIPETETLATVAFAFSPFASRC